MPSTLAVVCGREIGSDAPVLTGHGKRPVRPAPLQDLHDRMAAHEVPNPHIRDDEDRAGDAVARVPEAELRALACSERPLQEAAGVRGGGRGVGGGAAG